MNGPAPPAPAGAFRRNPLAALGDRLVAADPAYTRLRLAGRGILSLVLTGLLLATLTLLLKVTGLGGLPIAAYGLGIVTSFVGALAVRDRTVGGAAVTRMLMALVAASSAALAGWLDAWPLMMDAVYLPVIFVSVYVRRFGMRWMAIGMAAFMAYFMGAYLRPAPSEAVWLLVATGLSALSSHAVTNWLLPDHPERNFRRAMATIDSRLNLILADLGRAAAGRSSTRRDVRVMRRQAQRLRDMVLMAEGFIPQIEGASWPASGPAAELATALFDMQLAVERLMQFHLSPPSRARMLRARRPAAAVVPGGGVAKAAAAEGGQPLPEDDTPGDLGEVLLARVRKTRARIERILGASPSAAFADPHEAPGNDEPEDAGQEDGPDDEGGTGGEAGGHGSRFWPPSPAAARALQVTLAAGAALAIGTAISPVRWYWAVITAYIVFNNTRTRADTAMRAAQRSAGTVAGVLVGTGLAVLVHGNMAVSLTLLPVCFFLGFYFLPASYGTMIFFITLALALLYGMMGMFSPQLLLLRLVETLIGAVLGVAAAFLVFPVRSGPGVEKAVGGYLDALGAVVDAARARARGEARDIVALSRALDRAYGELATAVRPLGGPWGAVTRFGQVRTRLLLMLATVHWARTLSQALQGDGAVEGAVDGAGAAEEPPDPGGIAELCDRIDSRLAQARALSGDWFRPKPAGQALAQGRPVIEAAAADAPTAILALAAIRELMDRGILNAGGQPPRGEDGDGEAPAAGHGG